MSITFAFRHLLSAPTSESVMARYAKTGEQKLLSQLYDTCGDDLYHFMLTLSDPHLAEDICQKTWLKVIEKKHLYTQSGQFKAWLFTLARNLLIDELRCHKVTHNDLDNLPANGETLDESSMALRFDQALNSLAFEQREAFCLQQEGFSLEDICRITHAKHETIKSRLRYAKQHLRKHLNTDGEA